MSKETHTRSKLRAASEGEDGNCVEVLMIKSKKKISNDAVKRNRASRRVFWALQWCLQRRDQGEGGRAPLHEGITRADNVLLAAHINRQALDTPMPQLVQAAEEALRRVKPGREVQQDQRTRRWTL